MNTLVFIFVLLTQAEQDSPMSKIVKRGIFTRESCASACLTETAIKCRFVNFNSLTGKCILSTSLGVGIQISHSPKASEEDIPVLRGSSGGETGKENLVHKMTQLEKKLNEMKENVEEFDEVRQKVGEMRLEAEKASKSKSEIIDELQNSKMHQEMAVASLNRKVGSLAVGMQRILSDTKAFQSLQYRFEKELAEMKHNMGALSLQVSNILEQTSQLPLDLTSIKQRSEALTKEMNNIKNKDNSLMQDLMAMKSEMTSTHQSLEPQLKEIKMSQATIIEDMSHLGNSEENNRKKLTELQTRIDHNGDDTKETVTSVNTLRTQTRAMEQTIKETQTDISKLNESYQNLQTSNAEVQQHIALVKAKQGEEHTRLTNTVNKVEKSTKSLESMTLSQSDIKTQIEEMTLKLNDIQSELATLKAAQEPISKIKDLQRTQDSMQLKLKHVMKEQADTKERLIKLKSSADSEMDDISRQEMKHLSERLDDVESAVEKLKVSVHNLNARISSKKHHRVKSHDKARDKSNDKGPSKVSVKPPRPVYNSKHTRKEKKLHKRPE